MIIPLYLVFFSWDPRFRELNPTYLLASRQLLWEVVVNIWLSVAHWSDQHFLYNKLSFSVSLTTTSLSFLFSGTSHDWRMRCDAVNLYYTLFGLTRPSCLPPPELGLVLNLKEKKAILNPTIKPELRVGNVMDTPASIGIHGVGMSYTAVSGLG